MLFNRQMGPLPLAPSPIKPGWEKGLGEEVRNH